LSKLFDRLKNAARLRGAGADRGLLELALQRAARERAQMRAANDQLAGGHELATLAGAAGDTGTPTWDDPIDAQALAVERANAGLANAESERAEREAARATFDRAETDRLAASAALAQAESDRRLRVAVQARAEADRAAEVAATARAEAETAAAEEAQRRAEAEEEALSRARQRAEAEAKLHEQECARLEASERALHAATERARADQHSDAMQVSSLEARESAAVANRDERELRMLPFRKRVARGIAALVAILALAVIAWHFTQRPSEPTVPVFQLDKTLR
jgi:hypothetical protein